MKTHLRIQSNQPVKISYYQNSNFNCVSFKSEGKNPKNKLTWHEKQLIHEIQYNMTWNTIHNKTLYDAAQAWARK